MGLRRLELALSSVGRRRFLTAVPGGSFVPTDIPSVPDWFQVEPGKVFKDTALTTPATSTLDVVKGYKSFRGLLPPLTQSTTANAPTLYIDTLGRWFLLGNGTSTSMQSAFTLNVPYEIHSVMADTAFGNNEACTDGVLGFSAFTARNGDALRRFYAYLNEVLTPTLPSLATSTGDPFSQIGVSGIGNTGSVVTLSRDRYAPQALSGGSLSGNPGGITIFSDGGQSLFFTGYHKAVIPSRAVYTTAQRCAIMTYAASLVGLPPACGTEATIENGTDSGTSQAYQLTRPSGLPDGTAAPLVIHCHGASEVSGHLTAAAVYHANDVYALTHAGCRVISSDMHGDSWGSDTALADLVSLYSYAVNTIGLNVSKVIFWGQSMGAVAAFRSVADPVNWPNVIGCYGVDPVLSLDQLDNAGAGFYSTSIRTAWGGGPATWATKQPISLAASKFDNKRLRFIASPDDTIATKVANTDAMVTLTTGHALENGVNVASGNHGDVSQFTVPLATDKVLFAARC